MPFNDKDYDYDESCVRHVINDAPDHNNLVGFPHLELPPLADFNGGESLSRESELV